MDICKFCKSTFLTKNGIVNGKQRWLCKTCNKNQHEEDKRYKYEKTEMDIAIALYLNSGSYSYTTKVLSKIFNKKYNWVTICNWIKESELKLSNRMSKITKSSEKPEILHSDKIKKYVESGILEPGYALLQMPNKTVILKIMEKKKSADDLEIK